MVKRSFAWALVLGIVGAGFLLFIPAATAGGCHAKGPGVSKRGTGAVQVDVGKCQFSPTVLFVDRGTEVTWKNYDPVPHTVTGAFLAWGSADAMKGPMTYRFTKPGVYPYYCVLHPGMAGAVVVGELDAAKKAAEPLPPIEPIEIPSVPEAEVPAPETSEPLSKPESGTSPAVTAGIASMTLVAGFGAARLLGKPLR